LRAVADADDLELAREPVGDALHHVRDEAALQAVQRTVRALVAGARHEQRAAVAGPPDIPDDAVLDLALRALHAHVGAVDRDSDAARHRNRLLPNSRQLYGSLAAPSVASLRPHGPLLPDLAEHFAADLALARFPVGQKSLVRGEDRDAHAAEHARDG